MASEKIRRLCLLSILFAGMLVLSSCASRERIAVNQLDTPEHHTFTGLKLLEQGKYADASRAFRMAIQLNKNYSRAYTGMSLVHIHTGRAKAAWDNLDIGLKCAATDQERILIHVAKIRYFTVVQSEVQWLNMAANEFDQAVGIDSNYAPAYYFMGLAYKQGLDFVRAEQLFSKVLSFKTEHMADALTELNFLKRIQKVKPVSEAGKRVALSDQMTRADAAALFIEELKIRDHYKKLSGSVSGSVQDGKPDGSIERKDTASIAPEEKMAEKAITGSAHPVKVMAKDIANHLWKTQIEAILETGVKGLDNDPRGNFNPKEILSRAEYAIMMEDIFIKLSAGKDVAAKPVSAKSLFPDVPAEMPYSQAIRFVASQGLMEAHNLKTGEFSPLKPLSGIEALMTIQKLKEKFKIS